MQRRRDEGFHSDRPDGRLTDGQDTVEEVEAELRDSHWEIIDAEVSFRE